MSAHERILEMIREVVAEQDSEKLIVLFEDLHKELAEEMTV
jgi:hypothetical protein